MKCRFCNSIIEDDSLYCRFCGERLFRQGHKTIKLPKPRRYADGSYGAQIMLNGVRQMVYGESEEDYRVKATALKKGIIAGKHKDESKTLKEVLKNYVDSNSAVLSPSSIRGYRTIYNSRFKNYMDKPVSAINWQQMVNDDAKLYKPKTVKNSWGLVATALNSLDIPTPKVNLPVVPPSDKPFLDDKQIKLFLEAIKGHDGELAAILALHSLRISELLALTVDDIYDDAIHINKALVPDDKNKAVLKDTNKTAASSRTVPIMIPRLLELIPESGRLVNISPPTINREIARACKRANLPVCSCHDLRRSFASLGYFLNWSERSVMAIGGWSNMNTVHKVYIKLSGSAVNSDISNMKNYYNPTTADSEGQ